MQTFKQFLLERRSRPVSLQSAIAWMEENAMDYLRAGKFLYRGIKGEHAEHVMAADTNSGEARKSIGGMANYYTLWMTHHPEWEGKPRRERSFICSSSLSDAASWGHPHIVVPGDDAKIGAVGANDIWNRDVAKDLRLAQLTNSTQTILTALVSKAEAEDPGMTFGQLVSLLKSVPLDKVLEQNKKKYMLISGMLAAVEAHEGGTLYDLWADLLDPSNFEFMGPGEISGGGEFWVDGRAVYIPVRKNFSREDTEALIAWAEGKAPKLAKELKKHWK